nr:protein spire isoform X1 [Osmia lignaria]XP_034191038.1 protein spire isoform X1 [Osmia lignaria]XP_034191039.1 protein spire isoform X1 [Osmia lignaria]XP_034191040.1 protein spire isoform X1 [Osmia lignaria]XP_034191042.1 protein spire isoform X1 [Osmia lignaria]XP_034191043.1 protein spire isoform X1 [Osmia lignaria]XP_034191044.1 protein spire isoform X1 [Osmia lignaria]XP_034191045.1 protein spire isoform X1 [Osmia lignaria]XP_034191046.1 protein spire isoform X1 [Osmia lignaria]
MTTNKEISTSYKDSLAVSDDEKKTIKSEKKKEKSTNRPKCRLDANGRLNLKDILISFNGPVSQEQAWALCYQTAKSFSRLPDNNFYELLELSQIVLHKDGDVWLGNLIESRQPRVTEQKAMFSLGMMIFKALDFGLDDQEERPLSPDLEALITLMTRPDQECGETEERPQETDDEGIERDSSDADVDEYLSQKSNDTYEERPLMYSLKNVMHLCTRHMQTSIESAEAHYKAVIRAFVTEALELSQFLDTVAAEKLQASQREIAGSDNNKQNSMSVQNLDTLDFIDWTDIRIWRAIQARFWVQVIQELRKGVKLKKVEANLGSSKNTSRGRGKGAEFELTPYEILMDDIRERRYRLRKTPSPTPHLRKDAHAVILEFIRSRPPLKKASERQLPPLQKEWTLRELLMESIKKPPNLRSSRNRYVPKNERTSPQSDYIQSTGAKENESPTGPKPPRREVDHSNSSTSRRKIIPVDFDLKLDAEDEDDDEDYNDELAVTRFEEEDETSHYWQLKEDYSFVDRGSARHRHKDHRDDDEAGSANPWRKTGGLRLTRNEYHRFCDAQLESYDLATQCPSRRASARKHAARRSIALTALTGTTSLPHSRPQSRQHIGVTESTVSQGPSPNISLNPSPSLSPQPRARQPRRSQTIAEGTKDSEDQNEDWQDDKGQKPTLGDMFLDERLSLTLEEIVHIRSVLTKAELESLPVEGRVKEDVEKRRVCFLCLKTRFGLLGPWGQRCRLCERTVCVKCYSKMRIPTEHFAHVPVVLLSPGLLLSPSSSEPDTSKSSWLRGNGAAGSAPASPASRRKDSSLKSATPSSTPTTTPVLILTPTSTPPSHARREMENQEKRSYKGSGSPANVSSPKAFSGFTHQTTEQRLAAERLRGVSMVVCHDCRIMVIQIIKSSRTTRATIRNNVISRLTLNLSPAYV